ncbi:MAG: CocE/NonD family hydrolase [Chitinophagaceae bacterium]|nr:MAG: CocE/NonD family hydrolase [Chitinophagaceae bacterium]
MRPLLFLFLLAAFLGASAQNPDSAYARAHYDMAEYHIPMRDGAKLFTIVYTPKDAGRRYPFLMNRTPYNASGHANYHVSGQPSRFLVHDGYIIVYQDVRGRYMSEGSYNNMTPNIPGNDPKNRRDIDESSDTWDTIDWLLKNVKNNNGRVGIFGISYPGFYSAAALPDAHPALRAASPQAPISDFFFDDFHHNGAYLESYTPALAVFGYQKKDTTRNDWFNEPIGRMYGAPVKDAYDFYLRQGPLKNITKNYQSDNFFWQQIVDHPNYDTFWQKRNLLPHLNNISTAVMTVGGWFDAEDLAGPLKIYKTIERTSPKARNTIVMGPWAHGDWARENGRSTHNHLYFGDSISTFFQREIEARFFAHYLKDEGANPLPEAYMFNTGTHQWQQFDAWPPRDVPQYRLYFGENGKLSVNKPTNTGARFDYVSDPARPVPYTSQVEGLVFTPRRFMSDDQRYASRRPDVLTFETDTLTAPVTLAGEIVAKLKVVMTGTDADFVVKLIDVYPQRHPEYPHNPPNITMGGYQQLVRSEVFRGRFRKSFVTPEAFVPGRETEVEVPLQDVLHTFKPGHRIMIQIHSTWFPYIDRNPQTFVPNIYKADEKDFRKSTITVTGGSVVEAGGSVGNKSNRTPEGKKVF